MQIFLLALLLMLVPAQATGADRCDSLHTAAKEARAQVISGKGKVRSTSAEKRRWRRTVRRLLNTADRVRACYGPLSPPDQPAPSTPDDAALPAPASLARHRVMRTYRWAVLAHRELHQYDAAFQQYEAFFQRFGAAADSSRIAFMYNSRGYLQFRLGNLTEAVNDYTRTIAYTPAADTLDRAELLIDLGTILQKMDDLHTAQRYYVQAERLMQDTSSSPGRRRKLLARTFFNQGDVLLQDWPGNDNSTRTARHQEATNLLQQAIALHPDGGWQRLPQTHIILSKAYRLTGNFEAAFRHLEQGRQLAESLNDTKVRQTDVLALAAIVRGKTEIAADRLDAAAGSLKEGLRFAELGDDHEYRFEALQELGALYEQRGDPARAESYYRQAITVANELRASLRATEWAAHTSDTWLSPHRGLVRVLVAQDRPKEAFLTLDRARARHLQDLQTQIRLTSTLPARERVRFDSLTAALADIRTTLATEDLSADRRIALKNEEIQLMTARRALLDLDATASLSSVATLQQQLQVQERVLVAYAIDDSGLHDEHPASLAFVVTPNAFRTVPLDVDDDSTRAHLAAISPLLHENAPRPVDLNTVNFDLDALHRLYTDVFAPVHDVLPADLPLTVIPDGPLFRIPFGMLVTEPPAGRDYTRASYLIRERPIGLELSAALLGAPSPPDSALAVDITALGRTTFDTVPTLPPAVRSRLDTAGALPALSGVRRELDMLRNRFAHRQILINDQATEHQLHALQSQTQILHLASHALIHPSDPLANLFVLSPGASGDDGLLFVHELSARPAPVPLVVLSGCRTADGLIRAGEGPRGLQYAFRASGAQSTLATLWDVDDQATVALTASFYDHLIDGHPKDVALQQAQLAMLERFPDRASPFFWAGAVLYGTPQPLALEPTPPVPLLPVAAGGAILLLVALGIGYARYYRHPS